MGVLTSTNVHTTSTFISLQKTTFSSTFCIVQWTLRYVIEIGLSVHTFC